MTLERRVAQCYKTQRISAFINEDIKQIKKLNLTLQKLEKYNRDIYILETFNILKILNNIFDINKLYLVICELTDIEYHCVLGFLIEELNENVISNNRIIQKFQQVVEIECAIS